MGDVFMLFWWLTVVAIVMMAADFVVKGYFEKEKAEQIMKFFLVGGALAGFFILFRFVNEHLLEEIMVFYETFF
jgi:RsiW-degrading membrane proteinase PrsW (M82 family)